MLVVRSMHRHNLAMIIRQGVLSYQILVHRKRWCRIAYMQFRADKRDIIPLDCGDALPLNSCCHDVAPLTSVTVTLTQTI